MFDLLTKVNVAYRELTWIFFFFLLTNINKG